MLLINNSGFGAYGEFPAPGVDHTLKMIDVNVRAPIELTGRLWDELKARGGMVAVEGWVETSTITVVDRARHVDEPAADAAPGAAGEEDDHAHYDSRDDDE